MLVEDYSEYKYTYINIKENEILRTKVNLKYFVDDYLEYVLKTKDGVGTGVLELNPYSPSRNTKFFDYFQNNFVLLEENDTKNILKVI